MYVIVKHIHLTCVALSVSLLLIRFFWMLRGSPMLTKKWVKIAPHAIDTLLLISAGTLCVLISQYPLVQPWLTEKLFAVVAYIIMGYVSLKGRTLGLRWVGIIGAMSWIGLIAHIAISKQPILLAY